MQIHVQYMILVEILLGCTRLGETRETLRPPHVCLSGSGERSGQGLGGLHLRDAGAET